MIARTWESATEWLQHASEPLETNETGNNLLIGIACRLRESPPTEENRPLLATVEDGDDLLLAAVMTPPHKLVLSFGLRGPAEAACTLLAGHLGKTGWSVPGVLAPDSLAEAFAGAWCALAGVEARELRRERIYELREAALRESTLRECPGRLRPATGEELDLVTRWTIAFQEEALPEENAEGLRELVGKKIASREFYLWEDGTPVSMAAKTRPTPHGISVNLVYTPPELRRRGYATACVAHLSRDLLRSGCRFVSLFTDLANPTSNSIYQRIGYRPVCDFLEIGFGGESGH